MQLHFVVGPGEVMADGETRRFKRQCLAVTDQRNRQVCEIDDPSGVMGLDSEIFQD